MLMEGDQTYVLRCFSILLKVLLGFWICSCSHTQSVVEINLLMPIWVRIVIWTMIAIQSTTRTVLNMMRMTVVRVRILETTMAESKI